MTRSHFLTYLLLHCLFSVSGQPNVVIIYADDIGYGDFSCYTPGNRLKTPNVDKLAQEGLRFDRAYSTSATCTPSRYSLLTGEYPWRKNGINLLAGDASAIIRSGHSTIASVFQRAGYTTGVVGKWHLGLGDSEGPDWNGLIKESPNDVGFDYSFIMAATGDRVPTVFVENSLVVNLDPRDPIVVNYKTKVGHEPTGRENPELLKVKHSHGHDFTIINGIGRIGYMAGGKAARWVDETMADTFTSKAVHFIEQHKQQPFLLYFATHDVHVPRAPHPRFTGKSGHGLRGDALLEFDWTVGEIMKALEENGLLKNTLVILSSDNGPVVDDGYHDGAVEHLGNHQPGGPLRGGKYSIFEGGTRVPFIVSYPGKVKAGISGALFSQVDLFATLSALIGEKPDLETKDSQNQLSALLGKDKKGRKEVVVHSQAGGAFAIIQENWKYITPTRGAAFQKETQIELGNSPSPQLYHLKKDIGEKDNLAEKEPALKSALEKRLAEIKGG